MDRVALCGPMYSGKSTLARCLESRGYLYVNFTRTLKVMLAHALQSIDHPVVVEQIEKNKSEYRSLLQSFSAAIEFNTHPKYVERALKSSGWLNHSYLPVVFDNVRTPEQFAVLRWYGFKLVHLDLPGTEIVKRAERAGVSQEKVIEMYAHPIENSIPDWLIDVHLDATKPVEELAEEVVAHAEMSAVPTRTP